MNLQNHIATIKELDSIIEGLFKHCTNRERKCMYVTIVELECEPLAPAFSWLLLYFCNLSLEPWKMLVDIYYIFNNL